MASKNFSIDTKIVHASRNPSEQGTMVNPPIYQTSTIVFDKLQDLREVEKGYVDDNLLKPYQLKYGRYGTQTNFALEKAIAQIEGGYCSFITPSGVAAINTALMAFLQKGDHILIADNAYSPTREFADGFLDKLGISASYYKPDANGADLENLITENTKVIFLESPGSLSFEIQDFDSIVKIAKKHNIITILDNSWASGIYFKAFEHDIDVTIMALTKYINGHSDVMMGSITIKDEKHFKAMHESFKFMCTCAAPFNAYLVQRGLRTAKLRMDHSYKNAVELASFLEKRSEVVKVLYPALPSDENHQLWQKYFTGAAGLFSIILDKKYSDKALANMVDNLDLYAMGYSWGGFESLILPFNASSIRSASKWQYDDKTCLRINVGLEDIEDLKADLAAGLGRLKI